MITIGIPTQLRRLFTFGGLTLLALVVAPATIVYGLKGDYLLMTQWFLRTTCTVSLILLVMAATTPPSTDITVRWCRGLALYVALSCIASHVLLWADVFREL